MQKINQVFQIVEGEYQGKISELKNSYQFLSVSYRKTSSFFIASRTDAFAYAFARMPATLSVLNYVLNQLPNHYKPLSILDLGCGTGASIFASRYFWKENIPTIAIDHNKHMILSAEKLVQCAKFKNIKFFLTSTRLTTELKKHHADIVFMSYLLGEIESSNLEQLIHEAWNCTHDFLIITLPGTHQDFEIILKARNFILDWGGTILAPCFYKKTCPLAKSKIDWRHFSIRLQRTNIHQSIKLGTQNFEDEKFCYLICSKKHSSSTLKKRIIKKPLMQSGHITMDLCCENGLERVTVNKKNKAFKNAKKLQWGDCFE